MAPIDNGEEEWYAETWEIERREMSASNSSDFDDHEFDSNASSVFTLETDDPIETPQEYGQINVDVKSMVKVALKEVAERTIYSTRENSSAAALVYELFDVYSKIVNDKQVTVKSDNSIAGVFLAWKLLLNPNTRSWQRNEMEKKLFENCDDF